MSASARSTPPSSRTGRASSWGPPPGGSTRRRGSCVPGARDVRVPNPRGNRSDLRPDGAPSRPTGNWLVGTEYDGVEKITPPPGCFTFTGTVSGARIATSPSCGNGVLDAGEECDPGIGGQGLPLATATSSRRAPSAGRPPTRATSPRPVTAWLPPVRPTRGWAPRTATAPACPMRATRAPAGPGRREAAPPGGRGQAARPRPRHARGRRLHQGTVFSTGSACCSPTAWARPSST